MLEPHDRQLFVSALRAPDGYRFDEAIGTTFTLDLAALMAAPLAFSLFDVADTEEGAKADPLHLLDAVRRHAARIHLFCQAGQIGVPSPNRPLLAFLEASVIEVNASRKGHLFHPKVWAVRYEPTTADGAPVRYRLLVMSRNLTFDRSWDTLVCLEGELVDRKNAFADNHPLGDFFAELPRLASRSVSEAASAAVTRFEQELRRVRFDLPEEIERVAFHPLGLRNGKRSWPLTDIAIDRQLTISPFVSESFLDRLHQRGSTQHIVARVEELAKMPTSTVSRFESVHVLNDAVTPEPSDGEANAETALVGLHAKIFAVESGREAHLFVGSANATDGAWTGNVEFMVELVGRKNKCGIDSILTGGDKGAALQSLLRRFEPGKPSLEDELETRMRSALEKVRLELAAAGLVGHIEAQPSERYALTLRIPPASTLTLSPQVTVRHWPASLAETLNARVFEVPRSGDSGEVSRFEGLALRELTSFFAFHTSVEVEGRSQEIFFALNLPLEGDPPDRKQDVLRSFLSNPKELLRYLLLLLGSVDAQASADILTGDTSGAGVPPTRRHGTVPLAEALIRALHEDPSRIDEVERVVSQLSRNDEGTKLLPEGFELIWQPILSARKELST